MKALIVDDERLARNELRRLLAAHPEVEIVGEAANADEADELLHSLRPDLMLLDIHMPGRSGFELLESLESVPQVIFCTAYEEHSLRAFEASAVDYLVKPVTPERLARALDKISANRSPPRLSSNVRVFIKDGDRCWFVGMHEIATFESEGNHTRVYFGSDRPLIYRSLNYLESRLDSSQFFRASRKHIINLRWVQSVDVSIGGGLDIAMKVGPRVEMSRRQAQLFRRLTSL